MAGKVYSFHESRNKIVHEIATKLGKMHKELIERQQQTYNSDNKAKNSNNITIKDAKVQIQSKIEEKYKQELNESLSMIIEFYKLLIKYSSHIFEAEYRLRKSKLNA